MSLAEEVKKDAKIIANDLKGSDNYLTSSTILAGIATAIVLGILIFQYISTSALLKNALKILQLQQQQVAIVTPAPTPTPIPLPRGSRAFAVSGGGDDPQIRDLKFSEFNPKIGENQTVTVSVLGVNIGVKDVEIVFRTDNQTKNYSLKLIEGDVKKGSWSTTIVIEDTHDYVYGVDIVAKSSKGQTSIVEPRFR